MATEVGVSTSTPPRSCRRAGCSRAACSSSTPRRAASSTTTRSRPSSPPRSRTASGSTQGLVHLDDLPDRVHVVPQPRVGRCSASRRSATRTRTCKLLIAPMARTGGEALGSMGTDTPDRGAVRPAAAAVRLLQAAVRAGHQPAARRHPRGAGHVARRRTIGPEGNLLEPRPGVVPPDRAAVPDHRQRRAGQAHPHRRRRRPPGVRRPRDRRASTASPAAARALREALDRVRAEASAGDRRRRNASSSSPTATRRRAGADPVAAAHRRRCTTT